jgi:hypothetical protein
VLDLLVFLVLLSVFSFDNLIRKVARDIGMPFQGDVPMLLRLGAFSFLMTLVSDLGAEWCRDGGLRGRQQRLLHRHQDHAAARGQLGSHGARHGRHRRYRRGQRRHQARRLPADCVCTGWILEGDDLDSGTNR